MVLKVFAVALGLPAHDKLFICFILQLHFYVIFHLNEGVSVLY